jgi:hypothetical protein
MIAQEAEVAQRLLRAMALGGTLNNGWPSAAVCILCVGQAKPISATRELPVLIR